MNVKQLSEENRKVYETILVNKVGFLEESPKKKSSTRLVFVVGSFVVLTIAGYMAYKGYSAIDIGIFIGAGIAALGGTKFFGTKNEVKDSNV